MAYCSSCGKPVADNQKFCPACGKPIQQQGAQQQTAQQGAYQQPNPQQGAYQAQAPQQPGVDLSGVVKGMMTMSDETAGYDAQDVKDNNLVAMVSYLSWLVLIPLFVVKDSRFVRFHANQGFVLFLVSLVVSFVGYLLGLIPFAGMIFSVIFGLLNLGLAALAVLGIINAVKGKARRLPIFGGIILFK